MSNDICFFNAVEMARQIRAGHLSAQEIVSAHLAQIERVNPEVNAIVTQDAEGALAAAKAADERQARGLPLGPLHGLPVAHKDLIPTKGMRTTFGSKVHEHFVPAKSALMVERQQQTKTNNNNKTKTPKNNTRTQTNKAVFG